MLTADIETKTSTGFEAQTSCYHCHEPLDASSICLDEHHFCCEGCKTVYTLLKDNGLCDYYTLEDLKGLDARSNKEAGQFDYLDDPVIENKLLDFKNETVARVTFHIPAIHCASCLWILEKLYKINQGITQSRVNFLQKKLHITYEHQRIGLKQIVSLLYQLGYQPDINWKQEDKRTGNRRLALQIGVAGFSFGNIMLFSFPAYFGISEWKEVLIGNFLQVLNIVLGTVTLFYSGRDYLKNAWAGIRQRELNLDFPLALGMLVFYFRSLFDFISFREHGYMDSLAGLVFFLLLGKWFQQKTYYHLNFDRDFKSYFPLSVARLVNGIVEYIPLDKIKEGDIISLKNEEIIPVEGLITKGNGSIDYSFVTGESTLQEARQGERVYCGGRQKGAMLEILVLKKAEESYLSELWNSQGKENDNAYQASRLAKSAGYRFTAIILIVGFSSLIFWLLKGEVNTALHAFTSVLIIACPCAVALAIPFTLGNAMRILGRRGFYLKNTTIIEKIPLVNTIVFDKTGTLTASIRNLVFETAADLKEEEKRAIASLAACSAHPVSRQIVQYLDVPSGSMAASVEEVPGQGISGVVNGASVRLGKAAFVLPGQINDETGRPPGTYVSINGRLAGRFYLEHDLRNGIPSMLETLGEKMDLYLISGDHPGGQEAITRLFPQSQSFFDQKPGDKYNFVCNLKEKNKKVMMIGDGLNDSGSLAASDVGVVISDRNNSFTPACDIVLDGASLDQLPAYFQYAKLSILAVYLAFGLAFLYNITGLSYAVSGKLSPLIAAILMPLSSVTVVGFGVALSWLFAKRSLK